MAICLAAEIPASVNIPAATRSARAATPATTPAAVAPTTASGSSATAIAAAAVIARPFTIRRISWDTAAWLSATARGRRVGLARRATALARGEAPVLVVVGVGLELRRHRLRDGLHHLGTAGQVAVPRPPCPVGRDAVGGAAVGRQVDRRQQFVGVGQRAVADVVAALVLGQQAGQHAGAGRVHHGGEVGAQQLVLVELHLEAVADAEGHGDALLVAGGVAHHHVLHVVGVELGDGGARQPLVLAELVQRHLPEAGDLLDLGEPRLDELEVDGGQRHRVPLDAVLEHGGAADVGDAGLQRVPRRLEAGGGLGRELLLRLQHAGGAGAVAGPARGLLLLHQGEADGVAGERDARHADDGVEGEVADVEHVVVRHGDVDVREHGGEPQAHARDVVEDRAVRRLEHGHQVGVDRDQLDRLPAPVAQDHGIGVGAQQEGDVELLGELEPGLQAVRPDEQRRQRVAGDDRAVAGGVDALDLRAASCEVARADADAGIDGGDLERRRLADAHARGGG